MQFHLYDKIENKNLSKTEHDQQLNYFGKGEIIMEKKYVTNIKTTTFFKR